MYSINVLIEHDPQLFKHPISSSPLIPQQGRLTTCSVNLARKYTGNTNFTAFIVYSAVYSRWSIDC